MWSIATNSADITIPRLREAVFLTAAAQEPRLEALNRTLVPLRLHFSLEIGKELLRIVTDARLIELALHLADQARRDHRITWRDLVRLHNEKAGALRIGSHVALAD